MEISITTVKNYLEYRDGDFFWIKSPNWSICIGAQAGTLNKGYIRTIITGIKIYNHQLSFLVNKGYIPDVIDHIDGDRTNNKIENLRDVTFLQNAMNRKRRRNNASGYKGVSIHSSGKWQAEISNKYIGLYDSPIQAAMAYNERAEADFGEYAVLNIIK